MHGIITFGDYIPYMDGMGDTCTNDALQCIGFVSVYTGDVFAFFPFHVFSVRVSRSCEKFHLSLEVWF